LETRQRARERNLTSSFAGAHRYRFIFRWRIPLHTLQGSQLLAFSATSATLCVAQPPPLQRHTPKGHGGGFLYAPQYSSMSSASTQLSATTGSESPTNLPVHTVPRVRFTCQEQSRKREQERVPSSSCLEQSRSKGEPARESACAITRARSGTSQRESASAIARERKRERELERASERERETWQWSHATPHHLEPPALPLPRASPYSFPAQVRGVRGCLGGQRGGGGGGNVSDRTLPYTAKTTLHPPNRHHHNFRHQPLLCDSFCHSEFVDNST
jgi:hypothetical protein